MLQPKHRKPPSLVEGPERGTGDENRDVDELLALMTLQQAMREAHKMGSTGGNLQSCTLKIFF